MSAENRKKPAVKKTAKDRELLFVKAYLANNMNATQACITAGFSEKGARVQGARMLTKPNVVALIAEAQAKDSKKLSITRESLLADIQIAKDMALNSEQPQYQSYLKAIEMQAKMLGLNEPERLDVRLELEDSRPIFGA